jgi:hypothetical protein
MSLSGRILADYNPGSPEIGEQPPPRGSSSGVPLRERSHPGVGEVRGTGSQMRHEPTGAGGGTTAGAFYGFYTVPDGDDVGDICLQGGTIGGEAVATLDLKLYDASEDAWEGTMDEHLYVTAAGDGVVEDLVLLPGFVVSAITGPLIGTPPADSLPTALDASGACRISLGVFTGSGFMPAAIGNRSITFCPGGAFIVTP